MCPRMYIFCLVERHFFFAVYCIFHFILLFVIFFFLYFVHCIICTLFHSMSKNVWKQIIYLFGKIQFYQSITMFC